ncbi:MAG: hypothetical protein ACFFBD_00585 [Candidatus Hodarchaeota archaeon]
MKYYVAIGEASKRLGVCIKTIRRLGIDTPPDCSWRGIYSPQLGS